jgi:lipoprotein-anchoring transpeptidase ErfK/SrfK
MSVTSLNHKTIRPGSLVGYSYYHSDRRPVNGGKAFPGTAGRKAWRRWAVVLVLIVVALAGFQLLRGGNTPAKQQPAAKTSSTASSPKSAPVKAAPAAIVPAVTNHCAGNTLGQLVLVSISQRHLWACQGSQSLYDSPVITGMQAHASTLTPTGTYHIYAKHTDITLTGSDVTGSWSDPVQYWMPFLNNQYGIYGFHDATWRADNAFGNVSPDSADASHGCVELPLAASQWLYNWVNIGTAVTIES